MKRKALALIGRICVILILAALPTATSFANPEPVSNSTSTSALTPPYDRSIDWTRPYPGYTGNPYTKNPTELITQASFGNEWVNTIPDGGPVPSPYDHHGYIAGAPGFITHYDVVVDYFRKLEATSPRLKMYEVGRSNQGRPMYAAVVASADTIARIDDYEAKIRALQDPRVTGEAEAQAIIKGGAKPVYAIMASVHATEPAGVDMSMELAYRLCVSDAPEIKRVRENVITLFLLSMDPDGRERMANTYEKYKGTEYDGTRPPFWSDYIEHDLNRDFHVASQPETRATINLVNEWLPQAGVMLHQSRPFLYISMNLPPTQPAISPIHITEWQMYAMTDLAKMTSLGMPGVNVHDYVNAWTPFGGGKVLDFRNMTGRLYEIFGYPGASTKLLANNRTKYLWNNPDFVPEKNIYWSYRDSVNYAETACIASLNTVVDNKEMILRNFWEKNKEAVTSPGKYVLPGNPKWGKYPYAYVIPSGQRDMPEVGTFVNLLSQVHRIEVNQATSNFIAGGKTYPQGSYILRMDQPYAKLIQVLLGNVFWDGAPIEPGKTQETGWTMGLLRDIDVDRVDDPVVLKAGMTQVTEEIPLSLFGHIDDEISTGDYAIEHRSINNIARVVFGLSAAGYTVYSSDETAAPIERGDVIVPANQDGVYDYLESTAPQLGLTVRSISGGVTVAKHLLNTPRVANYIPWENTRDDGWIRYVWDSYGIPYTNIDKNVVRAGNLKDEYDAIVLSTGTAKDYHNGRTGGPDNYDLGPVNGTNINGGLGDKGVAALKAFVEAGGCLILQGEAIDLALTYGIVDKTKVSLVDPQSYSLPGSVARVIWHESVFTNGLKDDGHVYAENLVMNAPDPWVVASYPESNILESGYVTGEDRIAGKAAMVDYPLGKGRIFLSGADLTNKGQVQGEYILQFNAILNWDANIPAQLPDNQ